MTRYNHRLSQFACSAWLLCALSAAAAVATAANDPPQQTKSDSDLQQAIDVAKAQLAKQLSVDATTFKVVATEAHTWPDSSLGCAKPGKMSAQVITQGYIVTITSGKNTYQVHATDRYAVICGHDRIMRAPHGVEVPLKMLGSVITRARTDLATRLNVKQSQIRTVSFQSVEWPDTSMNCAIAGETIEHKLTKGYRIALNHAGRIYVYHTDMVRVRACPAIEAE